MTSMLTCHVPLCSVLSPAAMRYIAHHVRPHTIYPGHMLCYQGDDADCMWVLSDGARPSSLCRQRNSGNCVHGPDRAAESKRSSPDALLWHARAGEVALHKDGEMIDVLTAPALIGEYVMLAGIVKDADLRPFGIR